METTEDEYFGLLGVLFYSGASFWLALKAYRKGSDNTDRIFLILWLLGAMLLFTHTLKTVGLETSILAGYGLDILLASWTIRYNFWPRKEK